MKPYYYSLDEYNKATFGKKLYKLSLQGGTTCPNRDGTKGTGGCIFCSSGGSGEFTENAGTVTEQLEKAVERIQRKIEVVPGEAQFIAYFQSFTSTYGDINLMRSRFLEAASWHGTAVVDIATRPDCLSQEVLSMLRELSEVKPVWVELGLQTANEKTAEAINRCYPNETYIEAVRNLHAIGIPVITHVILGLPGETRRDMLRTIRFLNEMRTDGVKLQLMHVLKGTVLADLTYTPLTMEEYIDLLCEAIAHLRPETVIHRITGDGDKKLLIAPLWSGNKRHVLNSIHSAMRQRNLRQGSAFSVE